MPGRLTPSPCQANAIELPSGDQAGECASRGAEKTVRPVPSAAITPSVFEPLFVNAIRVPSGDHAGSLSPSMVGRPCRAVPSALPTSIVALETDPAAIIVPSGDQAGARSKAKSSRVCVLVTGSSAQSSGGVIPLRKITNATRPSGIADNDPPASVSLTGSPPSALTPTRTLCCGVRWEKTKRRPRQSTEKAPTSVTLRLQRTMAIVAATVQSLAPVA